MPSASEMMKEAGYPDSFVISNGPEDGIEFPITTGPVSIGRADECDVQVRLDRTVQDLHARATRKSKGYRIRSLTAASALVDGKRAGVLRSRVLRTGGKLQVGHTELTLRCSQDGYASQGWGSVLEYDLVWVLRAGISKVFTLLGVALGVSLVGLRFVLRRWWIPLLAIAAACYFAIEPFRNLVNEMFEALREAF